MLTATDLQAAVSDLLPRVEGGQVQRIFQRHDGALLFQIWRPVTGALWLVLSADPVAPRLAEAAEKGPMPPRPPALCQWARSTLAGRRLDALRQIKGERVVILEFAGGQIVAELFGRQPNIYAIDEAGRVVAMARQGAHRDTIMLGEAYTPPPQRPAGETEAAPHRVVDPESPAPARQIEIWATARLAAHGEAAEARRRRQAIEGVRRRLTRLIEGLEGDTARHGEAEDLLRQGELLKGQLHLAKRGAETVKVQDWYAPDALWVEIALDPKLDGPENVQRLFARYKKAKAGAAQIAERITEAELALLRLEEIEASDLDAEGVEAALKAEGLSRRRPQQRGPGRAQGPRMPFTVFTSVAGEAIWVGRGGADNHATTFHHARGNDQWLHVRDAAGSHVIAPCPARGRDPHPETLKDAAALAVHHSKIRGESPADVMVARRKHVRAIPGAGPGRVSVSESRSVTVYDGPERIERLYSRR